MTDCFRRYCREVIDCWWRRVCWCRRDGVGWESYSKESFLVRDWVRICWEVSWWVSKVHEGQENLLLLLLLLLLLSL